MGSGSGCAPDTFLGGGLQTARDVLDAGSIGEPLGAHAAVLHLGPEQWHPDPEIFFARGGGPLLDVGPYYVAALVNLLGPIEAVEAFGRGHDAERVIGTGPRAGTRFTAEVPTYVVASYRFVSGVVASFLASFDVVESTSPHLEVHGTEGSLGMGDPNTFEGEVTLRSAWTMRRGRTSRSAPTAGRVAGIGLADMIEAIAEDRPHRASGAVRVPRARRAPRDRGRGRGPPARDQLDDRATGIASGRDARALCLKANRLA